MKLKFKNQPFQQMAVEVVADLFLGQEQQQSTFQIDAGEQQMSLVNEFGVGNALLIDDTQIVANMRAVQKRGNLQQTDDTAMANAHYILKDRGIEIKLV